MKFSSHASKTNYINEKGFVLSVSFKNLGMA